MRRGKHKVLTLLLVAVFPAITACGPSGSDPSAVIERAGKQMDGGNPQGAIDILQSFDERKPGNAQISEQLAFAWAQKGDLMKAAYYFQRVAELDPSKSDALLSAALSLQQAGDKEGALTEYRNYSVVRPDDVDACKSYAALALAAGRTDEAMGQYNNAWLLSPSADIALALGRLYLAKGDGAQAEHWFSSALEQFPESAAEARLGLLDAAMRAQDYQKAVDVVAQLRKENPGVIEKSTLKDIPAALDKWQAAQDAARAAAEKKKQAEEAAAKAAEEKKAGTSDDTPVMEIRRADGSLVEPGTSAVLPAATVPDSGSGEKTAPQHELSKEEAVALQMKEDEMANTVAAASDEADSEAEAAPPEIPVEEDPLEPARKAHAEGNNEEAASIYRSVLASNPTAAAWNEFSRFSVETGAAGQALAASLEATRIDPYNLDYAIQYLDVAQKVYDGHKMLGELLSMNKKFPESPVITLALARAYWSEERNAAMARILYDQYLRDAPDNEQTDVILKERDELPDVP